MDDPLIKKFVESYHEVEATLDQQKFKKAKEKYCELHNAYVRLNESEVSEFDKEVAFDQVTRMRQKISMLSQESSVSSTAHVKVWHFISVLLVLVALVNILVFVEPAGTGAIIAEFFSYETPIERLFTIPGQHVAYLDHIPTSLRLTGHTEGIAQVYAVVKGQRVLLFDSVLTESGSFNNICADTCDFDTDSSAVSFLIDVKEGELYLDHITYTR